MQDLKIVIVQSVPGSLSHVDQGQERYLTLPLYRTEGGLECDNLWKLLNAPKTNDNSIIIQFFNFKIPHLLDSMKSSSIV